jgi:hypothetical protein
MANGIVAFSVLQMLAFLYALAQKEFRDRVRKAYRFVIPVMAASSILYVAGVAGCYWAEQILRSEKSAPHVGTVLLWTLIARIFVIALYSSLGIGVLWAGKRGWI